MDKKRITIAQFEKRFFLKHTDIADDTVDAYELAFKLLSEAFGKNTLLSRINEKKIAEFKALCLARDVKKVSVNTYLRHIRAILNKAHTWGDITKKVKIELYKLPKRHPRILSDKERKAILKKAATYFAKELR